MTADRAVKKRRIRRIMIWVGAAILFQFILMNISAALYAYKLTHLKTPTSDTWTKRVSENVFSRTWRLFTGPVQYKQSIPDSPAFACKLVHITSDNLSLEAWYGMPDSLSRGTVILWHGLMGNKGWVVHEAEAFRAMGYQVMMVDVRNHGNSEGEVTTIGYLEARDVRAAFDYVRKSGEQHIYLWGTSMGAVEVLKSVAEFDLPAEGIILEAPFLSLQSHLKGRARILHFPQQPFGFLTSFWIGVENDFNGWGFRLDKYARRVQCPVLLQYGRHDPLVLMSETESIYAALASKQKKLVVYEHASHESLFKNDPDGWMVELRAFMH